MKFPQSAAVFLLLIALIFFNAIAGVSQQNPSVIDISFGEQTRTVILITQIDSVFAFTSQAMHGKWARHGDTLLVPANSQSISFSAPGYIDVTKLIIAGNSAFDVVRVQMPRDGFTSFMRNNKAWKIKYSSYNLWIDTEPDNTLVWNEEVIENGYIRDFISEGTQQIRVHHPRKGVRVLSINADPNVFEYHALWLNPTPREFVKYAVIPGRYHFQMREPVRGTLFAGGTAASAILAIYYNTERISRNKRYLNSMHVYRSTNMPTPDMVKELDRHRSEYGTAKQLHGFFLVSTAVIYVGSWIDAAGMFQYKFTPRNKRIQPYSRVDPETGAIITGAQLTF